MRTRRTAVALFSTMAISPPLPYVGSAGDYPEITFEYGLHYDRFCAEATGTNIDAAAVAELQSRLDEFRGAWRREAPQLLGAVVELTDAPFEYREAKAALSLCNPGSLSFPLIIDVRPYLRSIHGERARTLERFAATVFHESLHRYVNDRLAKLPGGTTPLLAKYRDEPQAVRGHIHLLAIYDEVYGAVGRGSFLDELIASEERSSLVSVFGRAREIVATEGAHQVICEISLRGCPTASRR